jgi:hypothetical protein
MADIPRDEDRLVVDLTEEAPAAGAAAPAEDVLVLGDEGPDGLPVQAKRQEDGSVVLPLRHPVTLRYRRAGTDTVREETVAELRFYRLTGADMRAIAAASQDAMMPVSIARSVRIPEGKFNAIHDRMDAADVTAACLVVGHFLGGGRRTGR